jgi:hypothetical protein
MKKCPNCQKEFPDSMRFCQTDGTPLGDPIAEAPADDPLKTTVVRQEDIFSSIPPADPFKTMVASSDTTDDSGDLLQLPEAAKAGNTEIRVNQRRDSSRNAVFAVQRFFTAGRTFAVSTGRSLNRSDVFTARTAEI